MKQVAALSALPYYNALEEIYYAPSASWEERYRSIQILLDRLCKQLLRDSALQYVDFFSRLNTLLDSHHMAAHEAYRVRCFYAHCLAMEEGRFTPSQPLFLYDFRTVLQTMALFLQEPYPVFWDCLLPLSVLSSATLLPSHSRFYKRLRACYVAHRGDSLLVRCEEVVSHSPLKVTLVQPELFKETIDRLWQGVQINLLNVLEKGQGQWQAELLVIEPDYLLNVTALSECYKEYGAHPLNFIFAKLQLPASSQYILLGNTANFFLDELIYDKEQISYRSLMGKTFCKYPFDFSTCQDLNDPVKERDFFQATRKHYQHLCGTVDLFGQENFLPITPEEAVLEPSFVCESLGVQGRLDLMKQDYSVFLELKSGKGEEFWENRQLKSSKRNHHTQVLLYWAMLDYCINKPHGEVRSYLLYSRYPALLPEHYSLEQLKQVINLRNCIVANEHLIQWHNSAEYTDRVLSSITADRLNVDQCQGFFWDRYLRKDLDCFQEELQRLSTLERSYFMTLYTFITKEQYINQAGNADAMVNRGVTKQWNASIEEKKEAGEIYYDLTIIDNRAASEEHTVTLKIPHYADNYRPNFREGDIVILYERNNDRDRVTTRQVFKASLQELKEEKIVLRLRNRQKNPSLFPVQSYYAIEHDFMDVAYISMFRSLRYYLRAHQDRRALLLGERMPRFTETVDTLTDDTDRAINKALAAQDYFLLLGPPGTGKTSRAMRGMIERFLSETTGYLLLLSYTNRAVDEMCGVLCDIDPDMPYIRIGSMLSCQRVYRESLLEHKLHDCTSRKEVKRVIASHRIVIGTVAAVSMQMSLFDLLTFDMAIVDEASQILEPHLLGILTVRNAGSGVDGVRRFVLIGDHKQLPAVVLQSECESAIISDLLREKGIYNFSVSLFERLYRYNMAMNNQQSYDMLYCQGRMHPDIATFVNEKFYGGMLSVVPLPHQIEEQNHSYPSDCLGERLVATTRLCFIDSHSQHSLRLGKNNESEAQIVAYLSECLYRVYEQKGEFFDPELTLGIITPYRSQIALIRQRLEERGIEPLTRITVDTVERYQGGQRDVIFYSCCVNEPFQLANLVNAIEEDGNRIDRKLNVALTRARKQLFVTGVSSLLSEDAIYADLIRYLAENGCSTTYEELFS